MKGFFMSQKIKYNNFEKGKKEARIGLDSEKELIYLINNDKDFRNLFLNCLNKLNFKFVQEIKAFKDKGVKSDILITDGNKRLGISMKSYSKMDFHQLDRRSLDRWKEEINMPIKIYNVLRESILRKAKNSNSKFIVDKDKKIIREFFSKNLETIIHNIFTGGESHLKLLLINDKSNKKIFIFKMEDVLRFLVGDIRQKISFTQHGNIQLGRFISVQRKGGDGSHIKIPKTNWKHPGNNLQFKFKPLAFATEIEKLNVIKNCNIKF